MISVGHIDCEFEPQSKWLRWHHIHTTPDAGKFILFEWCTDEHSNETQFEGDNRNYSWHTDDTQAIIQNNF